MDGFHWSSESTSSYHLEKARSQRVSVLHTGEKHGYKAVHFRLKGMVAAVFRWQRRSGSASSREAIGRGKTR